MVPVCARGVRWRYPTKGTEMSLTPPSRQNAEYVYRAAVPIDPPIPEEPPITTAPTLRQFWRSDARTMPGRRRPRWAGAIAFWLGLAAAVLLIGGTALELRPMAQLALPIGTVAVFFGLVAFVAGIGRFAGVVGIILALVGNVFVLSWLGENVF